MLGQWVYSVVLLVTPVCNDTISNASIMSINCSILWKIIFVLGFISKENILTDFAFEIYILLIGL